MITKTIPSSTKIITSPAEFEEKLIEIETRRWPEFLKEGKGALEQILGYNNMPKVEINLKTKKKVQKRKKIEKLALFHQVFSAIKWWIFVYLMRLILRNWIL